MPWILLVAGVALLILSAVILNRQGNNVRMPAGSARIGSDPDYFNPRSAQAGLLGIICVIIAVVMFLL